MRSGPIRGLLFFYERLYHVAIVWRPQSLAAVPHCNTNRYIFVWMASVKGARVSPISFDDIRPWLLYKHYAHRIPSISYSFGLFIDNELQAVCSFGRPIAHTLVKNVLGGEYQKNIVELNRLCANEGLPRNMLSYFVSRCLKLLPPPC